MDLTEFLDQWNDANERLLVHTSGSTGRPKPLWVEKRRMEASARITCQFLGLQAGDTALLCLPLDYIAGKMMVVRALTCGLRILNTEPGGHPLASVEEAIAFAAMIPMQVYNSLQVPAERRRLRQIRHLIIGGGPVDDALASELRTFPNAVWSTYGMTETLSHVALRRLSGTAASAWYTPFDSVRVSLNEDGCLVIDAPLVCPDVLTTNDLAEISDGRFRILGRRDNVVCSGGIKIQIEEVEHALGKHLQEPFCITKQHDRRFGEVVVLLTESDELNVIEKLCQEHLPEKYWRPKRILHVDRIPMTATGKVARSEAERLASLAVEI